MNNDDEGPSGSGCSQPPNKRMKIIKIQNLLEGRESSGANHQSQDQLVKNMADNSVNLLCPICFELIKEAHITRCGHTFCYPCILRAIEQTGRCPKCSFAIESENHIFPNFLLNELVVIHKKSLPHKLQVQMEPNCSKTLEQIRQFFAEKSDTLTLPEVDLVLSLLTSRKQELAAQSMLSQHLLLKEFLQHLKRDKDDQLFKLQKESAVIQSDLERVDLMIRELEESGGRTDGSGQPDAARQPSSEEGSEEGDESRRGDGVTNLSDNSVVPSVDDAKKGFNILTNKNVMEEVSNNLAARRIRMDLHFNDLSECYRQARSELMSAPAGETLLPTTSQDTTTTSSLRMDERFRGLDSFSNCLSRLTRYSQVRPLTTLNYTPDMYNSSSIVSSIEFDKDQEYFAIAGVTKRIKIYDYNIVLRDMVEIHYPTTEMVCSSKISCISWSSFHKSVLASSDYEGTVIVWDAVTAQKTNVFQEHEKRCWSVDFNLVDTKLIASGSDDARVKLWTTNSDHSVASLEAKANVCCVKFNPFSPYKLAFGSADHCVHYYDLRSTKQPLNVFKGHRKAVSYVKFLNGTDLVSASTDSQLKLWNVDHSYCLRSFTGHLNEKNFVGLATDGEYITCGSENNALYIYYKGLSKHLFQFKFDAVRSFLDRERKEEEVSEFVSAVCWRQQSNVIVAANSQGTIKVLELV